MYVSSRNRLKRCKYSDYFGLSAYSQGIFMNMNTNDIYALIVDSGTTVTAVAVSRTSPLPEDFPCVRRPVLRTTPPSEDFPCVRRPVSRTAHPPEDLPCARRPVSRTAHPPEDFPCVRRLVLRTVTPPEPFREHPKQEAALKSSGTEWFVRLVFCG
jgi:hypothetical protein